MEYFDVSLVIRLFKNALNEKEEYIEFRDYKKWKCPVVALTWGLAPHPNFCQPHQLAPSAKLVYYM